MLSFRKIKTGKYYAMTETFIYIDNLRLHAFHGVLPQERTVGNEYTINIKVGYPWEKAATTDNVRDTLNYAMLADTIKDVMMQPANLLETVAARISDAVRTSFPQVSSITLDLKKVAPPVEHNVDACGVVLEWKR